MIKRLLLSLTVALAPIASAQAQGAPFDLSGPDLRVTVTHAGATLPIAKVPNLETGDRVSIAAVLPSDQGARYLLVAAFLRGATNPPPRDWFAQAETWKMGKDRLELTVPAGADQLILFLVPETGGDYRAVVRAVRGQPGTFTRAAQELNQAAADRARVDAFLRVVQRREDGGAPEAVPPTLTRSLAIRLDTQCLERTPELQAACLTRARDPLLQTGRDRDTLTETLTGAPVDIAIQLSNSAAGGYGYYSPYISILRDVARLFGAFRSAQFQYIPTLAQRRDDRIGVLLNAAPSFREPKSVLVVPMPPVEPPAPPTLRAGEPKGSVCATRRDLLVPIAGPPAIYATAHLHDVRLTAPGADGFQVALPLRPDAARGGYVLVGDPLGAQALDGEAEAVLRGAWGFTPVEGPRFRLQSPYGRNWRAAGDEASLVVGRENQLELTGGAASCVSGVELEDGKGARPVEWSAPAGDRLQLKIPLARARAGPVTLLVRHHGQDAPARVTVRALSEGARLDTLALHAGDAAATLSGARLDLVKAVEVDGLFFQPGEVVREGQTDRLTLEAADPDAARGFAPGWEGTARVSLSDGRRLPLKVTIGPPRPTVALIGRNVARPAATTPVRISLADEDAVPADARLTFSIRATGTTRFTGKEVVEVATADGAAATLRPGQGLTLQDDQVAVMTLEPGKLLGPSAHGPLRFRVVRDGAPGEWTPLGQLVRLPTLAALTCAAKTCTLRGDKLFLLDAASGNARFEPQVAVPDGFTGDSLSVPAGARELHVRMRDAPDLAATVPRG